MGTALASIGDRLLTLLAPKAVASAGGCEYERGCLARTCYLGSVKFNYQHYTLYSNCHMEYDGCCA